jgi:putative transposase
MLYRWAIMPFQTPSASTQKLQFIHEWLSEKWSFSALCEKHGISRPTGYKWVERYRREGVNGLAERAHTTLVHPNALPGKVERWILEGREKHPTWGPKKLVVWIQKREGLERLCAISTAGQILRRHGLLHPQVRHRHCTVASGPLAGYDGSNAVWCIDFKGWFRLGNGQRCDPLTLTDGFSRYLLRCQGLAEVGLQGTKRICEGAFREYGLPQRIRSDNGSPFGSVAIAGLSALAIWWIKLGIIPERIAPGWPDQNGRHERMHLTMNETEAPPAAFDMARQQRRFNEFRQCFNEERPHEALGQKTPASIYRASERRYTGKLQEPEYGAGIETRKVQKMGEFSWRGQAVFLSETLRGETIGLEEISAERWQIRFGVMVLGTINDRTMKIVPVNGAKKRRRKAHRPVQK